MPSEPPEKTVLAANLSSRICHDLVSPVGAIVNGIDLIREIGTTGLDQEFSMISQSAERASSLLQFYRLAFGAVGPDSEDIARDVLLDRARALISSPRIVLDHVGENGPVFARDDARLLCLMLLCARSLTGMTGAITVRFSPTSTFPLRIDISGAGTAEGPGLMAALDTAAHDAELGPRNIEFALARTCAGELGVRLGASHQQGAIMLLAEAA